MQHEVFIAPSVLSADFLRLGEDLASIKTADYVHYDVMDGHFVPNLSFGLSIMKQVKSATELPLDVHLMVSNPDEVVPLWLEAGADILGFHWEAATHPHRLVSQIHEAGRKACIALNPGTPVWVLEDLVADLDQVLIMTVNPGFGGQSFIENSYDKLGRLVRLCRERHCYPRIEVDGGIGAGNAREVVAAGADTLVAGSAIFGEQDRARAIADIRKAGQGGLLKRA